MRRLFILLLILPYSLLLNGQIMVSGVVTTSENNQPLPGANIIVKGTAIGTIADIEGNYSIEVPENAILQFSFIGYEMQEIAVGNQTVINVTLEPKAESIEEIVVIGYGTQKKEDR